MTIKLRNRFIRADRSGQPQSALPDGFLRQQHWSLRAQNESSLRCDQMDSVGTRSVQSKRSCDVLVEHDAVILSKITF